MLSVSALKEITLFSQLPDKTLEKIAQSLKAKELKSGEILFKKGDDEDELIIVEQGKISVYTPEEGKPDEGEPLRIIGEGEFLGELAIIDQAPRSLSARAEENTKIQALSGDTFTQLLEDNPEIHILVMRGLSDRIRYTTEFLYEVRGWIGKIAKGDYKAEYPSGKEEFSDKDLETLAAEFAQMAAQVQKREEVLKQEVAKLYLRLQVDEDTYKSIYYQNGEE